MNDRRIPSWLTQWGRSPRQDRRVVVDGKFVELTPPIVPKQEEENDRTGSAGADLLPDSEHRGIGEEGQPNPVVDLGDAAGDAPVAAAVPEPEIPQTVDKGIADDENNEAGEAVPELAGDPVAVLPERVGDDSSQDVLAGTAGRNSDDTSSVEPTFFDEDDIPF